MSGERLKEALKVGVDIIEIDRVRRALERPAFASVLYGGRA